MGDKKIKIIAAAFLAALFLIGCGRDKTNTVGGAENSKMPATGADSEAGGAYSVDKAPAGSGYGLDEIVPPGDVDGGNEAVFRKGTWFCSKDGDNIAYISFSEDGASGVGFDLDDKSQTLYTYDIEGSNVTIYYNEYDTLISGSLEQLDEDTVAVYSPDGGQLMLTYVSDKTVAEFEFYSVSELSEMAKSFYGGTSENASAAECVCTENSDMTVTLSLYSKDSDREKAVAVYTVSRLTAEGFSDLSGKEVDLKPE